MLRYSEAGYACFKHPNFITVNDSMPESAAILCTVAVLLNNRPRGAHWVHRPLNELFPWFASCPNPTTSFLTAATLIYAIGAGITAAAGTRLALQLFLVKVFKLYSFRMKNACNAFKGISCHYLLVSGLGKLRACCLPWKW